MLEISPRMVRLYKDELEKEGIYIQTFLGKDGGYQLRSQIELPSILFNQYDIEIIDDIIKNWLKDDGYFILDTTNNDITESGYFEKEDYDKRVERYRRKWKKEDLNNFLIEQGFIIDELINYTDKTSNKEWLVYALKKDKK